MAAYFFRHAEHFKEGGTHTPHLSDFTCYSRRYYREQVYKTNEKPSESTELEKNIPLHACFMARAVF